MKLITGSLIKYFLLLFFPLGIIIFLVFFGYYQNDVSTKLHIIKSHELYTLKNSQQIIHNRIKSVTTDLMILATHQGLQRNAHAENDWHRQSLERDFLKFCSYKTVYDQIRFIDSARMEQVRINYNSGKPSIVSDSKLQFKGERYYFTDSINLAPDEIFVSPFDLNIEHGEVERPFKPMIRFGTSIMDIAEMKKAGIVLLNYLGSDLIQSLEKNIGDSPGQFMLLNSEGYWLKGVTPEDEWGFMFEGKRQLIFGHRFSTAWQKITNQENGQFINNKGIFTFLTVYPLYEGLKSISGSPDAFAKSEKRLEAKEYRWKLVSRVPYAVLTEEFSTIKSRIVILDVVLFVLLAVGCFFIADLKVKRKQVEEERKNLIIELKNSLDKVKLLSGFLPI